VRNEDKLSDDITISACVVINDRCGNELYNIKKRHGRWAWQAVSDKICSFLYHSLS
jgi:hypothetical protein